MTEKHGTGESKSGKYISFSGDATQRQEQRKQQTELDRAVLGKRVTVVVSYGSEARVYVGVVKGITQYWVYMSDEKGNPHIINKAFIIEYVLEQSTTTQPTPSAQSPQNRGGGDARQ